MFELNFLYQDIHRYYKEQQQSAEQYYKTTQKIFFTFKKKLFKIFSWKETSYKADAVYVSALHLFHLVIWKYI